MYIPKNNRKTSVRNIPRAEELTEHQSKLLNIRFRFVSLVESGKTPKQALDHLLKEDPNHNLPKTKRGAQKLYADYKNQGVHGLLDKRLRNKRPVRLTAEAKKIILSFWYARRAAGSKAIWKETQRLCASKNIECPGYETVKKFLAGQSENDKLVRNGRLKVWEKQNRSVTRIENTIYANERWQIDHCRLDIWIREFINNLWHVREVWLTTVLDAHSRSVAGFVVSTKTPDAWTNAILMRQAILPKQNKNWRNRGLPSLIQPDRGKDFLAHAFASSLAYLSILLAPDPPYYPNSKGKIERWFRTLDNGCLRRLPGHMLSTTKRIAVAERYKSMLLTRRQLMSEIENWIVDEYHQTVHSETGRKPVELWEETVRLRLPESDDALDNLLLKSDEIRRVQNTGVKFTIPGKDESEFRGGRYWSPEVAYFSRREVRVSYNPEDLESVLLYCASTGEYLCEVWRMNGQDAKYSIADIKLSRNQYRRGLVERQKEYSNEVYELDRRKARETDWNRAREEAVEIAAEIDDSAVEDTTRVTSLLDVFQQEDEEF